MVGYQKKPTGPATIDDTPVTVTRSQLAHIRQQLQDGISGQLRHAEAEAAEARKEWFAAEEQIEKWRERALVAEALSAARAEKIELLEVELERLRATVLSDADMLPDMVPLPDLLARLPSGLVARATAHKWKDRREIEWSQPGGPRTTVYATPDSVWSAADRLAAQKGFRLVPAGDLFILEPMAA
ncbi:hypothetical protein [Bradyrhizobium elkanii]|uniref:hypothetical protein n=1 Tax=Bradyrhizobium elkanii TaxID=29448 RepID=UPI00216A5C00|nr:hypothetical protein [Bradyrhizobium elkanii]MCS3689076.1 putative RNA-binding Zn ribbon-like protein [Bradyrhizobium elkanii]